MLERLHSLMSEIVSGIANGVLQGNKIVSLGGGVYVE